MLNTSLILRYIYSRMKVVISGVQAEACVPLEMAVSIAWGNHGVLCEPGCPPPHRSGADPRLDTSPHWAGLQVSSVAY